MSIQSHVLLFHLHARTLLAGSDERTGQGSSAAWQDRTGAGSSVGGTAASVSAVWDARPAGEQRAEQQKGCCRQLVACGRHCAEAAVTVTGGSPCVWPSVAPVTAHCTYRNRPPWRRVGPTHPSDCQGCQGPPADRKWSCVGAGRGGAVGWLPLNLTAIRPCTLRQTRPVEG